MLEPPRTYVARPATVEVTQWTGRAEISIREWIKPYSTVSEDPSGRGPYRRAGYFVRRLDDGQWDVQRLDRGHWLVKEGERITVVTRVELDRVYTEFVPPSVLPPRRDSFRLPPMYGITLIDPSGRYGTHKLFCEHGESAADAEASAIARYRVSGTTVDPAHPTRLVGTAQEITTVGASLASGLLNDGTVG